MTAPTLTVFLEGLERAAHEASIAEENYRREASERFRVLERERAFGFRRFNLMGAVLAALGGSKDEDEALAGGSAAFLREMSWSGTTDSQKETLEHFQPVIRAGWALMQMEPGAPEEAAGSAAVLQALTDFENWFASSRTGPFLAELDREIVELPLVEVC